MKSPRRILFWGFLALLAFGAGWWPRGTAQPPSLTESAPQTDRAAAEGSALNAPPAKWATVWEAATAAERRLLLESWKARDPGALYHFLRSQPPLSVPGQRVLESQALIAWGERDPLEAYPVACTTNGPADSILGYWLKKDLEQALDLVILRAAKRSSMGYGDLPSIEANPERVCERLAFAGRGLASDMLLKKAAGFWAAKDPAAALAFARTLPGKSAVEMMTGMIDALALPDAAALVLQPGKSELTEALAWPLMIRWGGEDAEAAAAWASENLPPTALAHALRCLLVNVVSQGESFASASSFAASLPPGTWKAFTGEDFGAERGFIRLTPYAPDWVLPGLAEKLRFSAADLTTPETTPEWFSALSPERAELVVREHFATNRQGFGPIERFANLPAQWQPVAAAGALSVLVAGRESYKPAISVKRALGELTPATRAVYLAELEHLQAPPERLAEIRKALDGPPDATAPGPQ